MTEEFEILYQLVFFTAAAALLLVERVRAWQRQPVRIARRWTSNVGLFLIGTVVTTVVIPVEIYAFAQRQPPGLMSELGLPFASQLILTFLLLDFWRYWEHRWFHQVRLLWRFHLVHHSDTEIDVTTSERHHPLEFLLGTATILVLIGTLGLPAPAIGLYLLAATVVTLYSHANLRLPVDLDRKLGQLIVTPAVHAMHHSALQAQTDSNYGSVLTVWDRLFGTYVDPAAAQIRHFGLGYFHAPKDTGLVRVLQQPFLYRPDFRYCERDDGPVERDAAAPSTTRRVDAAMTKRGKSALVAGLLGCVMVTLAMWPTVLELTSAWRSSESYQYAWLVVPMVVYLLGWHCREVGLTLDPRPDFSGVFVVLVAAACWGTAALMNIDVGRQFAFVLALQGVAMSTLGWRSYWRLFPTLALLFLMIPAGDLLQPALRLLTVEAIKLFAAATHLPHSVEGFVVFIGAHRYIVVDECSGLAYVTLATFLGYSFGLLLYRSLAKVVALALFGAFLGIVCNAMRVNAIVLIDWLRDSQMELTAHGNIQWIALFAILGLLFYVLSRLRPDETALVPAAVAPEQPNSLRRLAPVAAGLSMLFTVGSGSALATHELRPRHEMQIESFPKNISGWDLADSAAVWSIDERERTESISVTYHRNGHDMHVVIVDTLSPTAKLPESKLAPRDNNIWRERQAENEVACAAFNCIDLRHVTWQRDKSDELRHVYYAYSIGKFTTNSRFALRAAHGWHRLTGGRDNPRLIGLVSEDAVPDIGELAGVFQILQSESNEQPHRD
jgi:exosortase